MRTDGCRSTRDRAGAVDLREAVEACARHGITAIDPWRDQVAAAGLDEADAHRQGERDAGDRLLPRRHVPGVDAAARPRSTTTAAQ